MAERKNNFYEEILKDDGYNNEKQASDNSTTKDMLGAFSDTELEALAEELNIAYEKQASNHATIEEKIAEDTQDQREEDKEDLAKKNADKTADPGAEEEADERTDATDSEEAETAKTVAEKEEIVNPEAKEQEVTAAEYDEATLEKVAYEVAAEKLASEGYTLTDYVFTQIPNEKIASFIADKAEKLASLSDKHPLQVADDIMINIADIIGQGE
jgi:hypothetical protein